VTCWYVLTNFQLYLNVILREDYRSRRKQKINFVVQLLHALDAVVLSDEICTGNTANTRAV